MPDWADFMTGKEYRRFRRLVDGSLRKHSRGFRVLEHDAIEVETGAAATRPVVGLAALARVCHGSPGGEWRTIVERHVSAALSPPSAVADPDLADVRSRLKVRIFADEHPGHSGDRRSLLVCRPLARGIIAALVIDCPDRIATVGRHVTDRWNVSDDELFDVALANVREQDRPALRRVPLPHGGGLSMLSGDSFFSATWLLLLDEIPAAAPALGWVAAVPNRHTVLCRPLSGPPVRGEIDGIALAADRLFREGPGSISPRLYWRRGNELTHLPTRVEGTRVEFSPPEGVAEALELLATEPVAVSA